MSDDVFLTHAGELALELGLVVAVCDVEVEVGVVLLEEDVGRDGGAEGEDGGRAVGALHDPRGNLLV
mgnify:FL=1